MFLALPSENLLLADAALGERVGENHNGPIYDRGSHCRTAWLLNSLYFWKTPRVFPSPGARGSVWNSHSTEILLNGCLLHKLSQSPTRGGGGGRPIMMPLWASSVPPLQRIPTASSTQGWGPLFVSSRSQVMAHPTVYIGERRRGKKKANSSALWSQKSDFTIENPRVLCVSSMEFLELGWSHGQTCFCDCTHPYCRDESEECSD